MFVFSSGKPLVSFGLVGNSFSFEIKCLNQINGGGDTDNRPKLARLSIIH